MGRIIGIDEAGYGPNLGPLVITATVWKVDDDPHAVDMYRLLRDVVCPEHDAKGRRLHVADSKQVYSPARGVVGLEQAVQTACGVLGASADSFQQLCAALCNRESVDSDGEPWFDGDLPLPVCDRNDAVPKWIQTWNRAGETHGFMLETIQSDVVCTRRFNRLIRETGSKGAALSGLSLSLLRSVWSPEDPEPTLIIADKHGGRNRYGDLLTEACDGSFVFARSESGPLSEYTVGNSYIRFQTKAEAHLPVALASMVCKYLRELAMELFNRYWLEHRPEIRPTKGYPSDARRFRGEIADLLADLKIEEDALWRMR